MDVKYTLTTLGLALIGMTFTSAALAGPKVTVGRAIAANQQISFDQINHTAWDKLLRKYVDVQGRVAYQAWKNSSSDVQALDAYINSLSRANTSTPATREAKLAFWINAYNAVTVKGILREYPTTSIRNHTAKAFGYNIWKDLLLTVGKNTYSLEDMEHKILRKMDEPRVHFAIVCASHSCPRLLYEAYVSEQLEEQLTLNTREFFANEENFRYEVQSRRFYLSSILSWFDEDFGSDQAAQLKTIASYLPSQAASEAANANSVSVTYLDYDWSLNDRVDVAEETLNPEGSSNQNAQESDGELAIGKSGSDESLQLFRQACANSQNGEHHAAARQIRRGVEFLTRESKHATAKGKEALDRSIHELSALADSVESGATNSVDDLKGAFARAHHALAYHYQQRASESWLRRRFKAAGQDLKAASYEVEYGISWVGEGVENKTRDTLTATRELGDSMIRGAKVGAEHVNSQAKNLGQQIMSFGRRVAQPVRR